MAKLRLVGKVKDAQGLRGDVFIIFFSKDYSWILEIETLYLSKSNDISEVGAADTVCYDVKKIAQHKDGLKVLLEGFSNRNQSEAVAGHFVYLDEDFFESEDGESLYLTEIENFQVVDNTLGNVGVVTDFSYNGAHDILVVTQDGAEYEIPFVEAFVVDINHEDKIISMDLPEGLLSINSNTDNAGDSDTHSDGSEEDRD